MTGGFARFLRGNTIALLALFVALSGTTFAAATVVLPKNSVGAKQLKKNAVINAKISRNAVTGAKVKGNSLSGADVLESSLAKVPSAASADSATNATNATNAQNAAKLNGLDSTAFARVGHNHDDRYYTKTQADAFLGAMRFPETGNGVGGNFGCAGTELGVRIANGLGAFVDDRFTFQVPSLAHGQIRSDGSIRSSSANVSGVTHTAGSGVYCVQFSSSPGDLEGAVVSIHYN